MTRIRTSDVDPRLTPIENNLFTFFAGLQSSTLHGHDEPDVFWYASEIAFPLFSGALRARFSADAAPERTHQVLDQLIGNSLPFMWWLSPSTRSPELEAVLLERGLVSQDISAGMHVDLSDLTVLDEALPDGVTVEVAGDDDLTAAILTMLDGFGMPRDLGEAFRDVLTSFTATDEQRLVNVLARVDGKPAGAGSLLISQGVAGLYNIAVPSHARGRGVGRAITLELMRIGAGHGCGDSILHATEMGLPVYQKLGFETVCELQQYLWMPN